MNKYMYIFLTIYNGTDSALDVSVYFRIYGEKGYLWLKSRNRDQEIKLTVHLFQL